MQAKAMPQQDTKTRHSK